MKLAIFDPHMGAKPGHFLEYAPRVAAAAARRGHPVVIFAHRAASRDLRRFGDVVPLFRTPLHERVAPGSGWRDVVRFFGRPVELALDQLRALDREGRGSVLGLVHTCTPDDLFAWAMVGLVRRRRGLQLALVLHENLRRTTHGSSVRARLLDLRLLLGIKAVRAVFRERARFYTDSESLTRAHREFARVPFETLPVPVELEPVVVRPVGSRERVRIIYAGDARDEKGFFLLPALADAAAADELGAPAELVVQANLPSSGGEARSLAAREALRARGSSGAVSVLDRVLDRAEYLQHIAGADIVLLPYDPQLYRDRTSGILAEALALGRVCVAPAGCWAGEQVEATGAGTVMERFDEESLVRAVRRGIAGLGGYARNAADASSSWRERTRADELVSKLVMDAGR